MKVKQFLFCIIVGLILSVLFLDAISQEVERRERVQTEELGQG